MNDDEIKLLYTSITDVLNLSLEKVRLLMKVISLGKGGYTMDYFLVRYKKINPVPSAVIR